MENAQQGWNHDAIIYIHNTLLDRNLTAWQRVGHTSGNAQKKRDHRRVVS